MLRENGCRGRPSHTTLFGAFIHSTRAGADEAVLCKEAGLPYASICMVDNYANGATTSTLTYSDFKDGVNEHLKTVEQMAGLVVKHIK